MRSERARQAEDLVACRAGWTRRTNMKGPHRGAVRRRHACRSHSLRPTRRPAMMWRPGPWMLAPRHKRDDPAGRAHAAAGREHHRRLHRT
eukprot:1984075-Alexandrium_andersonii.AAC.1